MIMEVLRVKEMMKREAPQVKTIKIEPACMRESFSFQVLSGIATLCDCEIGYLLCEYDCKTFDNSQIYKKTGLRVSLIRRPIFL